MVETLHRNWRMVKLKCSGRWSPLPLRPGVALRRAARHYPSPANTESLAAGITPVGAQQLFLTRHPPEAQKTEIRFPTKVRE